MNLKKNPELIPLIDWWEKDGKETVIYLLVAAVAVCGWYGWKAHQASVKAASAEAVVNAYTTEELEEAVSKFGSTAAGGALRIRLAKSYYDGGRYEEAMAIYDELATKSPDGFADIPLVGKAECLEGLGRYGEAQKTYDDFVKASPGNYLLLTAQLGAIRCLAQADKKTEAEKRLAALKEANASDEVAKARIEATEDLVKRYAKPAPAPVVTEKPVAKPVEKPAAKPVEKPAAKSAQKPAAK